MALWDLLLTGAIVAIAVWYLYRRFTASRGCATCCSSSCGSGKRAIFLQGTNHSCKGKQTA